MVQMVVKAVWGVCVCVGGGGGGGGGGGFASLTSFSSSPYISEFHIILQCIELDTQIHPLLGNNLCDL